MITNSKQRRYYERHREELLPKMRLRNKLYFQTPAGKAASRKYWQSEKGKRLRKKSNHSYYLRNKEKVDKANKFRRIWIRDYVRALKIGPCADCHNIFPPCAMDFDHVRGEKIDKVSELVARVVSTKILDAEIAKCDLVCACCHRIRHEYD